MVLVVLDGLGGVRTTDRRSEIHAARTPNLDALAKDGSSGIHTVVAPGVTPGSGAGHLALFGYDPLKYQLGRGALSGAGVGFDLKPGDVAARVNFCTIDENGVVTDRRAGRISTETNQKLADMLQASIDPGEGIQLFLQTERDHRGLMVLRGEGLSPDVSDTDPQVVGLPAPAPSPTSSEGTKTAAVLEGVLEQAKELLVGEQANFILLRGFDTLRKLPTFGERYKLKARGIAGYPMYLGIARILGMEVAPAQASWSDEVNVLENDWDGSDYFYLHHKKTDSSGEDGDFDAKVAAIEEVDATIPRILELSPNVVCITGDHSTPSPMRGHSWHPVPFVMWGPSVGVDAVEAFNEEDARQGAFGHVLAKDLMPLMLAAAGRLIKFGA